MDYDSPANEKNTKRYFVLEGAIPASLTTISTSQVIVEKNRCLTNLNPFRRPPGVWVDVNF